MITWVGTTGGKDVLLIILAVIAAAGIIWATVRSGRPTPPCGRRDTVRTSARVAARRSGERPDMTVRDDRFVIICSCSDKTCIIETGPDGKAPEVSTPPRHADQ